MRAEHVSAAAGVTSRLKLSRPAAAVLAGVIRSSQASKAVGAVILSHLGGFRPGEGAGKHFFIVFLFCFRP